MIKREPKTNNSGLITEKLCMQGSLEHKNGVKNMVQN